MDTQRVRNSHFICQKWTLFSVSLLMFTGCVVLAAMSGTIADQRRQYPYDKETDKISIIVMGVISGFFAFFGLIGSWKEHYCSTVTFAVFMTLNTIGGFYIAIQVPGFWAYAIIDLCITILAFSFAKQLRLQRILNATQGFIITQPQNSTVVVPIINGFDINRQFAAGSSYQQWYPPQYQPQYPPQQPPPYSQENQPKFNP